MEGFVNDAAAIDQQVGFHQNTVEALSSGGDNFISLSFLDQILSPDFLSNFQTFFEVKIDINRVNLTPF